MLMLLHLVGIKAFNRQGLLRLLALEGGNIAMLGQSLIAPNLAHSLDGREPHQQMVSGDDNLESVQAGFPRIAL